MPLTIAALLALLLAAPAPSPAPSPAGERYDAFMKAEAPPRGAAFARLPAEEKAELMKTQVEARLRTPSQLRKLDDQPAYTEDDYAEFDRLFGSKNQTPAPKGLPA